MREISFKMTLRDGLEGYRVGLSQMPTRSWIVWGVCLFGTLIGLLLIQWSKGYPATWPPTHLPPHPVLSSMGLIVGIIFIAPVSSTILSSWLTRSRTVQISPLSFTVRYRVGSVSNPWLNVSAIMDTGEHVCFCQIVPNAIVVPKSAFPNQEQARAFLEQATDYWHRATGRTLPPLDAAGVWPPAPRR